MIPVGGMLVCDLLGEALGVNGVYRYMLSRCYLPMRALRHTQESGCSCESFIRYSKSFLEAWLAPLPFSCEQFWMLVRSAAQLHSRFSRFVHCYEMALPFFRNTIVSDLIVSAAFIFSYRALAAQQTVDAKA